MTPDPSPPTVVVVGSTMIDLVAYASRFPKSGETLVGERFRWGRREGGQPGLMARLLGAEVIMVNCLGTMPTGT